MNRFKNILLFSDERGLPANMVERAAGLAAENSGRIAIIEVVEEAPRYLPTFLGARSTKQIEALLVQEAHKRIAAPIRTLRSRGIGVSGEVRTGAAFAEIIRKVMRDRHDLVIMAHDGRTGLKGSLLGGTTLRVVRKCPCPVWIVKPRQPIAYSQVLAAVDPSPAEDGRTALNRQIVELAHSLAHAQGGRLHIVHAWTMHGERTLRGTARMPRAKVDSIVRDVRAMQKAELMKLLEPLGLPEEAEVRVTARRQHSRSAPKPGGPCIHLLKGPPAKVIASLVRRHGIEIVVMGTTCRTGVGGFLMGSTAERVLAEVDCSVLTLKPPYFVSPVTPT